MTTGVLALIAAYSVLAVLLLSLNLRSAWPWQIKAAAIGLTTGFFVVAFIGQQQLLGWATPQAAPQTFRLHGSVVVEPDRRDGSPGAIYLWLSVVDEEGLGLAVPRAHALPYTREMHEQLARLEEQLLQGRDIQGRMSEAQPDQAEHTNEGERIELFEAPPPPPVAKTG